MPRAFTAANDLEAAFERGEQVGHPDARIPRRGTAGGLLARG
ncbi:hypothetical protein [Nostocoides japonicum]|nr:hypothetical protein [Tetrasphaera japonica]